MASQNPDDLLLLIRCPSCGQRFKVGEDLRDRTVECGGCENRFRIDDEVIVRGRKVYPGERKDQELNRFQRVPLPGGEKMIGVQPMHYSNQPDPAVLEPVSPQRIMAGAAGVGGMAIVALLLMFGGRGLLDGMDRGDRLMIAGFASVLAVFLMVYANPKARLKAGMIGLMMAAGVIALPFFFKVGTPVVQDAAAAAHHTEAPQPRQVPGSTESSEIIRLREEIGTAPLAKEIDRLAKLKSDKHAIGLWLRGMNESNRYVVMDYVVRVTGAELSSHFYPRDNGDFLLVVTGISTSMHELAEFASVLGDIVKIHQELSIVEVKVHNDNFLAGPIDTLSNKEDPAFYDLNKRELECIDLERIRRAVQRLQDVEPKIYRSDISRKLISLLGQPGVDFKGSICVALLRWSEQPGVAGDAAVKEVDKLSKAGKAIPAELVGVAVKERNPGIIPTLDELWFKNPTAWETAYGEMGPGAEPTILARFPQTEGIIRYSAARLLGRVGSASSLAVLEEAEAKADSELKVILEQARKAILGRIGK